MEWVEQEARAARGGAENRELERELHKPRRELALALGLECGKLADEPEFGEGPDYVDLELGVGDGNGQWVGVGV